MGVSLVIGNRLSKRIFMIEDCVILGGGIAGLSAANRLAEAGKSPLIIEAGKFPSHRICGEFLSHECLSILRQWDIPLSNHISQCCFFCGDVNLALRLPLQSGACSRFILDTKLLERAVTKGARAMTETTVTALKIPDKDSSYYELHLSNGQKLLAKQLMIGTGRIPRIPEVKKDVPLKYVGMKAHFQGIDLEHDLEMFCFPGGYLGMSAIGENVTNIACIVSKKEFSLHNNPQEFLLKLQESQPIFRKRLEKSKMLFPNWLSGEVPEFGIRQNPSWDGVYWIGDAAGGIPPVSGDGLAIAITSGYMAADYFLQSNSHEFKNAWIKRYKKRFYYAKLLHSLLRKPYLGRLALGIGKAFPSLPSLLWKLTREVESGNSGI